MRRKVVQLEIWLYIQWDQEQQIHQLTFGLLAETVSGCGPVCGAKKVYLIPVAVEWTGLLADRVSRCERHEGIPQMA